MKLFQFGIVWKYKHKGGTIKNMAKKYSRTIFVLTSLFLIINFIIRKWDKIKIAEREIIDPMIILSKELESKNRVKMNSIKAATSIENRGNNNVIGMYKANFRSIENAAKVNPIAKKGDS